MPAVESEIPNLNCMKFGPADESESAAKMNQDPNLAGVTLSESADLSKSGAPEV